MARGRFRAGSVAGLVLAAVAYFFHIGPFEEKNSGSSSPHSTPAGSGMQSDFSGPVVNVHDGDTLQVRYLDQNVKIRLWGVDTPEVNPKQECGVEAREFTNHFAMGKTVRVEVHDRDRYGRVVGEVFVDGKSLNAALADAGWAWAYRHYTEKFVSYEEKARAQHKGLWAHDNPVAPWDFRKESKN